jgi:hypothetical protein
MPRPFIGGPSYDFGGSGFGAGFGSSFGRSFGSRREKLQKSIYDHPADEHVLPSEEEIQLAQEEQEERDNVPGWVKLLRLPDRLMGGQSVKALLSGDIGDAFMKNPVFQLADVLLSPFTNSKITGDYTEFRDVREAWGQTDVDEGIGNMLINLAGEILTDPSSFFIPYKAAAQTTKVTALGRGAKAAQARKATMLRKSIEDAGGDAAATLAKARKGEADVSSLLADGLTEDDFWLGTVKRTRSGKEVLVEAVTLSDQVRESATRSLMTFGLLGSRRQLVLEGPIFRNMNLQLAHGLDRINDAFHTAPVLRGVTKFFNKDSYNIGDVYDDAGNLVHKGAEKRKELTEFRREQALAQQAMTNAYTIAINRAMAKHGKHFAGNKDAEIGVTILLEAGLREADDIFDAARIVGTGMSYGRAQNALEALIEKGDPEFLKLRDRALAGEADAIEEYFKKYPDTALDLDSDVKRKAMKAMLEDAGFSMRPGVDYRAQTRRIETVMRDRMILNALDQSEFRFTGKVPGVGVPAQEALAFDPAVEGSGRIRMPFGGVEANADEAAGTLGGGRTFTSEGTGDTILISPKADLADADSLRREDVRKMLSGFNKSRIPDPDVARVIRETGAEIKKGDGPVSLSEIRAALKKNMKAEKLDFDVDEFVETQFMEAFQRSSRGGKSKPFDGIVWRSEEGKVRVTIWNEKKLANDLQGASKLADEDLEAVHQIHKIWDDVPGSGDEFVEMDTVSRVKGMDGVRARADIEETTSVTRDLFYRADEEKAEIFERLLASEDSETLMESIRGFVLDMQASMKEMGKKEQAEGLLNMTMSPYFPRILTEESRKLINEHVKGKLSTEFGERGVQIAESFTEHRAFTDLDTFTINMLAYELGIKFTGMRSLKGMAQEQSGAKVVGKVMEKIFGDELKVKLWKQFQKTGDQGAREMIDLINMNPTTAWYSRASGHARMMSKRDMLQHMFAPDSPLVYGRATLENFIAEKAKYDQLGMIGVVVGKDGAPTLTDPGRSMTEVILDSFNLQARASWKVADEIFKESIDAAVSQGDLSYVQIKKLLSRGSARRIKENDPSTWVIQSDDLYPVAVIKQAYEQKALLKREMDLALDKEPFRKKIGQLENIIKSHTKKLDERIATLEEQFAGGVADNVKLSNKVSKIRKGVDEHEVDQYDEFDSILKDLDEVAVGGLESAQLTAREFTYIDDLEKQIEDLGEIKKRLDGLVDKRTSSEFRRLSKEYRAKIRELKTTREKLAAARKSVAEQREAMRAAGKDARSQWRARVREMKKESQLTSRGVHDALEIMRMQESRGVLPYDELVQKFGPEKGAELMKTLRGRDTQVAFIHKDVYASAFAKNGMWDRMHSAASWQVMPTLLDKFTQWWKLNTTVGGPFLQSRFRDVVSNFFLLGMGGTDPREMFRAMGDSWSISKRFRARLQGDVADLSGEIIKRKDGTEISVEELWQAMNRGGLINASYVRDEMLLLASSTMDLVDPKKADFFKEPLRYLKESFARSANPFNPKSAATSPMARDMMGVADKGDAWTKTIGVISEWRMGRSLDDAVAHTKKWSYGTGDFLTKGEQEIRRFIPFYSWARFAIGRNVEQLFTRPAFSNFVEKTSRTAWAAAGNDIVDYGDVMPSWLRDNLGIPISKDEETGEVTALMFGSYIPIGDLTRFASSFQGLLDAVSLKEGAQGGNDNAFNYIGQSLTPPIKTAIEFVRSKSFFRDTEITKFPGDMEEMYGISMPARFVHVLRQFRLMNEIDRLNVITFRDVERVITHPGNAVNREIPGREQASFGARALSGGFGFAPRAYEVDFESAAEYGRIAEKAESGRLKGALRRRWEAREAPGQAADISGLRAALARSLARLKRFEDQSGYTEKKKEAEAQKNRQRRGFGRGFPR